MSWIQLKLFCEQVEAEALSDVLSEQGALAVTVEPQDGDDGDNPVFGEPDSPQFGLWPHCQIEVLLSTGSDVEAFVSEVSACIGRKIEIRSQHAVEDQDWVRLTQSQFEPIPVGSGLWIVPTWHELPDPHAINLRIDPGQAFGTGSHPTTLLCLQWLLAHRPLHERLLDYGCGSGILTLAAALLGAPAPIGVDIDPVAVATARDNALRNNVDIAFYEPDQLADDIVFDGIVANILTNPLIVLAPLLLQRLRPGGWLTLSGVLATQAHLVCAAYAPTCLLSVAGQKDGWVCLHGVKQVY